MRVSVVIPSALDRNVDVPLACLKNMDYPAEDVEVFVVYGNRPCTQRNLAIDESSGEFIFFFDNDCEISSDNFRQALKFFEDNDVGVVGGPSMSEGLGDSFFQKTLGYIVASPFGMFSMYARYTNSGVARVSGEKELIFCNLCIRKSVLVELGGLNEELYPNEENELVTRLTSGKYQAIYEPDMRVSRKQRKSFKSFIHQFFTYGWGRMRHALITPKGFSPVFLAPTVFTLYLLSLFFFHPSWYMVPLVMYSLMSYASAIKIMNRSKSFWKLGLSMCLFPVLHISYGVGVVCGLSKAFDTKARKDKAVIKLEKVKGFGEGW